MKNKKILLLVLVIIFIVAIISIVFIKKNTSNSIIIEKGYQLFGDKHCKGHGNHKDQGATIGGWPSEFTCKICGITKENEACSTVVTICSKCSKITGRCEICGGLLKK